MNWKAEATDKLKKYPAMCIARENLRQELKRVKDETGPDGLVCRRELSDALTRATLFTNQVELALDALPADEQLVLKWLFLQPKKGNVERLCQELCVEQSTVYRRRDKALSHFTTALYGV